MEAALVQIQLQNHQAQTTDGMLEVTQEAQILDQNQEVILDGISIILQHQLGLHHHIQACKIVQFQATIPLLLIPQVIIIHQLIVLHTIILHLIAHQAIDHRLHIVHPTIRQATIADHQLHMEVIFREQMYMELTHLVLDIIQTAIKIIMEILSEAMVFLVTHTSQIIIMGLNVQVDQDF